MPIPERAELERTVDELIAATRKGAFQWRPVNPSTYIWESPASASAPGAKITLQRVERISARNTSAGTITITSTRKPNLRLDVHEFPEGIAAPVLKLTVSGADDDPINVKLEELFQLISSGHSEEGLDFLKRLVEIAKG